MSLNKGVIGFTCAYTPLPLIRAAGFTPYRILPNVDCPDQAGRLLHDNLCPHVKRVLDRAMSGRIPDLKGMVFMNSCDSMRRLYDAWKAVKPDMNTVLIDLPAVATDSSVGFFRDELERLSRTLDQWGGTAIDDAALAESIGLQNRVSALFTTLREKARRSELKGGSAALQEAYNKASISSPEETIAFLEAILKEGADIEKGRTRRPCLSFRKRPSRTGGLHALRVVRGADRIRRSLHRFAPVCGPRNRRRRYASEPGARHPRTSVLRADIQCGKARKSGRRRCRSGKKCGGQGCHRTHGEVLRSVHRPSARRPGVPEARGYSFSSAGGRLHAPVHRSA